jgi:hypothetical protein
MLGHVAGHQGRAQLAGEERALLHIDGPHPRALFVVEHGQVHRAWYMVFGELGRAARIDDHVEAGEVGGGAGGEGVGIGHRADLTQRLTFTQADGIKAAL